MGVDIDISTLTTGDLNDSNDWVGTGVFDVLINAVNKNIEGQYLKGRITSTEYAQVYLGGLQSVIAESMKFLLEEKNIETQIDEAIKNGISKRALEDTQRMELELNGDATRALKAEEVNVKKAQKLLLDEQKESLKNSLLKDILKEASGGYAMVYEATAATDIPGTWAELDKVTNKLLEKAEAGISVTPNFAP